jgi:hypothetical protein
VVPRADRLTVSDEPAPAEDTSTLPVASEPVCSCLIVTARAAFPASRPCLPPEVGVVLVVVGEVGEVGVVPVVVVGEVDVVGPLTPYGEVTTIVPVMNGWWSQKKV